MTETEVDRKTLTDLIQSWRERQTFTVMEMLKVAFKPIVDEEVRSHLGKGIREDDVRKAAERILIGALSAYEDPTQDPVAYVVRHLEQLKTEVGLLHHLASTSRKGP
jgi:hypothetical protein